MKLHRMLIGVVAAVGLLAPAATAAASGDHHSSWKYDYPAPISAQEYLTAAAAANQFEIVTGQLAQERAGSPEIKALGAEFVADHTKLLQQGSAVAAKLGITVTPTLTPKQQRIVARLQQLTGKRFDRKWLIVQIAAHREALALNLRAAIRGDVPDIRMLAQGALPIITHHYGQLLDLAGDYRFKPKHDVVYHGDHGDDDGHDGYHHDGYQRDDQYGDHDDEDDGDHATDDHRRG